VSKVEAAPADRSTHTVECSDGKVPISGGWHDPVGLFLNAGVQGATSSYPSAGGWTFIYWSVVESNVEFFVICANAS